MNKDVTRANADKDVDGSLSVGVLSCAIRIARTDSLMEGADSGGCPVKALARWESSFTPARGPRSL